MTIPTFMARVPVITYLCPEGHKIPLRYDLFELLIPDAEFEKDFTYSAPEYQGPYTDTKFVYCKQEDLYYPVSDCSVVYPNSTRRSDQKMKGKGVSEAWDRAVIKERVIRLLVISGLTQAQVAERVGITQARVAQIAGEVPALTL